jgi:hypothetical protein
MTERASFFVAPANVPRLRDAVSKIAGVGYSESLVRDRLGLEDLAGLQWHSAPVSRAERLSSRDPLALAIDLFLLQGALPAEELDRLFVAAERDVLIRAGLLAIDEMGWARARASLFPVEDRLIFSDHAWPELPHPGYAIMPSDQVMKIGLDSRHLARCTVRRPFRAALDLCTGSGIHALLASTHARQVLAVDINPRAACCTRFNAQISGAANVEVVIGDLFEAVRGERFDLITANPPFVPSPVDALLFRDGGPSGEDIQKRIVAGLPRHLVPGGIAQVVTELGERDDEPLVLRLREWLNGAPMDIHILRLSEHTAMKYAIGHAQGDDYPARLDSIHEWASNLRAQGYRRVVSVVISFQWSDAAFGAPWDRVEESRPPYRAAGPEIDAAFLAERLTRHPDWQHGLTHSWVCRAGPIALLDARMLGSNIPATAKATVLGRALTIDHLLDPVEREIVARMEGRIPVPELIGIFRDLHVDEPAVIAALRSLLRRRLVRIDGLLGDRAP